MYVFVEQKRSPLRLQKKINQFLLSQQANGKRDNSSR